jgi:hypothetical protein
MPNQEIAIAISGVCFGLVIGFLSGYAVRAYISYVRRRSNHGAWGRIFPRHKHRQPPHADTSAVLLFRRRRPPLNDRPQPYSGEWGAERKDILER